MISIIVTCLVIPQDAFSISSQPDQAISISNANPSLPIELNKKVFTWTDRVYITIYAPDFNSDPNIVDQIGVTADDKITIATSGNSIPYRLVETGPNTGIFGGYVTLTGESNTEGFSRS